MQDEAQPMLRVVVQVEPLASGGVVWTLGVSGLTADAVPVAVAAVQAVVGSPPAGMARGDLFRLLKKPGEAPAPVRQVTESVSLEFCPLLGPCRRWPAASSPACAPDLGKASEQAPCAACRHAGSPGLARPRPTLVMMNQQLVQEFMDGRHRPVDHEAAQTQQSIRPFITHWTLDMKPDQTTTLPLHADVLREAVRAAADRARDSDKLKPEQAAVAVVAAFQAAQAQLSASPAEAELPKPLGSVVVDVMPDGVLRVQSSIGGVPDSGGYFAPSEAGEYITKALQEVRSAVRSAVISPEPAP